MTIHPQVIKQNIPQLTKRQFVINRVFDALEDAAKNSPWNHIIKLHVETEDGMIAVSYEIIPLASSNRSFYQQDRCLILRITFDFDSQSTPWIIVQRTTTLLGTYAKEDQFQYFGVNEPELRLLIEEAASDVANLCPLDLRHKRQDDAP